MIKAFGLAIKGPGVQRPLSSTSQTCPSTGFALLVGSLLARGMAESPRKVRGSPHLNIRVRRQLSASDPRDSYLVLNVTPAGLSPRPRRMNGTVHPIVWSRN